MIPNRQRWLCMGCLLVMLAGCSTTKDPVTGDATWHLNLLKGVPAVDTSSLLPSSLPQTGSVLPNTTLQLTPSLGIPLEKLVFWGAYAAAAYLILDPLAPNWEIEQAQFPENRYHLSMKMKRYYSGGAGEARVVFHQRAKELMRVGGYSGYEVLEYTEGLDSSVLGSQRVGRGVIQLTRR